MNTVQFSPAEEAAAVRDALGLPPGAPLDEVCALARTLRQTYHFAETLLARKTGPMPDRAGQCSLDRRRADSPAGKEGQAFTSLFTLKLHTNSLPRSGACGPFPGQSAGQAVSTALGGQAGCRRFQGGRAVIPDPPSGEPWARLAQMREPRGEGEAEQCTR